MSIKIRYWEKVSIVRVCYNRTDKMQNRNQRDRNFFKDNSFNISKSFYFFGVHIKKSGI